MSSSTPSRNAPCPCGSGRKYKHCHGRPGATEPADLLPYDLELLEHYGQLISELAEDDPE